jgi:hypothetical protein
MKRITRRQACAWLHPMRKALSDISATGTVDAVQGYAVTRLHDGDDYARLDYCCAGFRGLMTRLWPDMDCSALHKIERRLAAGVLLETADIVAVLRLLKDVESKLMKRTVAEVKAAVLAEQIVIEMEALGLKEAA